ncbi:hypothetical protein [Streptomyces sp. PT19]
MSVIYLYDEDATYGPYPNAQPATDTPADPIYDDGAQYGADRATEK